MHLAAATPLAICPGGNRLSFSLIDQRWDIRIPSLKFGLSRTFHLKLCHKDNNITAILQAALDLFEEKG
ncbi:hypothetical protein KDI_22020 [Dictyobacter arantiisoli]|uniref:Uncharacterized protein n=1 Tax=Dictyobacter arantiisoli TaxID=2014874 RepID=A0A5A5TB60_9CHLR|nr:hypothetical protein KDI_22020 [Dictyobacter arantiisoli]